MTAEKTITVSSSFGDKEVTMEEFVNYWVTCARQVLFLSEPAPDHAYFETVLRFVDEKARARFERCHKMQHAAQSEGE